MIAETIPALLRSNAQQSPRREAVVDPDSRIDYASLDAATRRRAAALIEASVNKGHRVGLLMQNSVEWAVTAFAVMRMGAVLVPLSTMLRPAELETQLAIAGVRHLIAVPQFLNRDFRGELADLDRARLPSLSNIWWSDEPLADATKQAQAVADTLAERLKPADEMAVLFTSASSGDPKGVIHTHGGALRANAAGHDARCVRADTRLYLPMPLFWTGGFAGGLISALNAGCTLITEAVPRPASTLDLIEREKVTLFRGWPDQAERMARDPAFAEADLAALQPGSLDAVMPGASPPHGARGNLFGMTESFGPYCGHPLDDILPAEKSGSCGKPFKGIKVRIADYESGAILGAGKEGSIQIGGPNILKGICGREREDVFTNDGWFDTGDMGHVDKDGFLFFAGRRDDMVKVSGATAYPREAEQVLQQLPGVVSAAVCAIELDGQTRFGAAITLDPSSPGLHEIASKAAGVLSAFKQPRLWLLLDTPDALPRKTSDKIDKAALRALIERDGVEIT